MDAKLDCKILDERDINIGCHDRSGNTYVASPQEAAADIRGQYYF